MPSPIRRTNVAHTVNMHFSVFPGNQFPHPKWILPHPFPNGLGSCLPVTREARTRMNQRPLQPSLPGMAAHGAHWQSEPLSVGSATGEEAASGCFQVRWSHERLAGPQAGLPHDPACTSASRFTAASSAGSHRPRGRDGVLHTNPHRPAVTAEWLEQKWTFLWALLAFTWLPLLLPHPHRR